MATDDNLHFVKTHNLREDPDAPAIYVIRDGRDALVSYAHWAKQSGPPEYASRDFSVILRDLLLEQRSPFGRWCDHVRAWTERQNTAVVRFEDLIRSPEAIVKAAILELGLDLSASDNCHIPSFAELKAWRPTFFRQGRVGAWRQEFPSDLLELFYEEQGDALSMLGYDDVKRR